MSKNICENTKKWVDAVKRLQPIVNALHSKSSTYGIQVFCDLVTHHLEHYGEKHALKLLKSYRTYLQQSALRQNVGNLPFCKTDKDNFPLILNHWKIDENTTIDEVRYLMSFWRIIEVFRLKPEYDVKTIVTKPIVDEDLLKDITNYIAN
jgi:hypothetical protein